MLVLAYGPADHAIVYLNTMSVAELSLPSTSSPNAGLGMAKVGMGALTGLGGYMGLGVKTTKPSVIQLEDGEALVTKDCKHVFPTCFYSTLMTAYVATSTFIGSDGKPSRPGQIEWSVPPEDVSELVISRPNLSFLISVW
jgi:Vam6/Vps39-like protein vacuolar protein sorting-associated protein 39